MNEQLLLDHIRAGAGLAADSPGTSTSSGISRADLARTSGLAKNTVSLALANLERAGLVRVTGVRAGRPGRAAVLYQLRPESGFVLGLDVGREYVRGAVADLAGTVRSRASVRIRSASGSGRVAELVALADQLVAEAGLTTVDITQTVLGSPGIHDPRRDQLALAGGLPGWEKPAVLTELRRAFGPTLMIENDVDAAALAEQAHGHGRRVDTFAFVSIGTGIGMGLVLNGQLHRGRHGAAGEIGFLPVPTGDVDPRDARRRGGLEAAASAAGIVRAARRAGARGPLTARDVFGAADSGQPWAVAVVAHEALLIARAICAIVTIVDPELVVLGGGVGQASGFLAAVTRALHGIAPVRPELCVSALGADAVVDGCLAAGVERAWQLVTGALPPPETAPEARPEAGPQASPEARPEASPETRPETRPEAAPANTSRALAETVR